MNDENQENNLQRSVVTRRRLLGIMGTAAIAAGPVWMGREALTASEQESPEATPKTARQWAMVIGLRKC